MSICPEGHTSDASDYCDVCGTPMDAPSTGSGATPAPAAPAAPAGVECPNCQTENVANALFCEACGYDFTTGTMPRPWVSPFAAASAETAEDDHTETESDLNREPDDDHAEDDDQTGDDQTGDDQTGDDQTGDDQTGDDQTGDEQAGDEQAGDGATEDPVTDLGHDDAAVGEGIEEPPTEDELGSADQPNLPDEPEHLSYSAQFLDDELAAEAETAADGSGALFGVSGGYDSAPVATDELPFEWVAEVWVDPDWYRQQEPPDPMPSPGLPTIVPLRKKSNLVGRPSRSRNIDPDVDCDSDPGASRRQAQLTTDGRRWWIEDLDSANGTYVAGSLAGLPQDPLVVGERQELDPDDRIYLGAWTRMVIRRATEEEIETLG